MTIKEMEIRYTTAPSIYDGGWRSEDREDIKDCYNLSDEEVDIICEELAIIENQEK